MRLVWIMINLVFWTIVLATGGLVLSIFEHRGRVMAGISRLWSGIILKMSGVSYRVKGLERLDRSGHYIFAGNHESAFDIPVAFAGLPFRMVPIAKIELRKIPFFGWAMRAGKHIFVDRHNHENARRSLQEARQSLADNPRSVLLFPEGTRSRDGKIHEFKKGGLLLAIETGIPVVPIALCGTAEVVTKGSWKFNPRPVELRIGHPIPTAGLTFSNRNEFTRRVQDAVTDLKQEWITEQSR